MAKNAQQLADRGVSHEENGAVLIDFTKLVPGKEGKRLEKTILRKRDGTALYLTRDVSELLGRVSQPSLSGGFCENWLTFHFSIV